MSHADWLTTVTFDFFSALETLIVVVKTRLRATKPRLFMERSPALAEERRYAEL
jgi:hypothetical protein